MKKVVRISFADNSVIGSSSNSNLNFDCEREVIINIREVNYLKPPLCFVFINETFTNGNDPRDCAKAEIKIIEEGLKIYHIKPIIFLDKTKEDILKEVDNIKRVDFNEYAGIMIIISSHGGNNNAISAKDAEYNLHADMLNVIFSNEQLKNKVKIVIVQACKGSNQAIHAVSESNANTKEYQLYTDEINKMVFPDDVERQTNEVESYLQNMHNWIIGYATFEGFKAYRRNGRSIFLNAFVDSLKDHGANENIMKLLNETREKVRNELKDHFVKEGKKMIIDQVSYISHRGFVVRSFKFQDYVSNAEDF